MRALLAGMGAYGAGWYRRLRSRGIGVAVVDKYTGQKDQVKKIGWSP